MVNLLERNEGLKEFKDSGKGQLFLMAPQSFYIKRMTRSKQIAKDNSAPHLWSKFMRLSDLVPWTRISLKEIHSGMWDKALIFI